MIRARLSRLSRPDRLMPTVSLVLVVVAFLCSPVVSGRPLAVFDVYNALQGFAQLGLLALATGLLAGTLSVALLAQIVAVTAIPDYSTQLLYAALLAVIVAIESPGLHQMLPRVRNRRTAGTSEGGRP